MRAPSVAIHRRRSGLARPAAAALTCAGLALVAVGAARAAAPPQLTGTTPASPANDNAPLVEGTSDPAALVSLFTSVACDTAVLASGTADGTGAFAISVTVPDDSTTTIWATADDGVVSECSTSSVEYVEDSTPPPPPLPSHTTPGSTGNDNRPLVFGTTEVGSSVTLYDNATCTGPPLGFGSSSAFRFTGIGASVPDDSVTTIHGAATDAVGNGSACSSTGVVYVEDSTPPTSRIVGAPAPVVNETSATFTITSGDSTDRFECSLDGGAFSACVSPHTVVGLDHGEHSFRVRATDLAGNIEAEPQLYVWQVDLVSVQTTIRSAPAPRTTSRSATFSFAASEASATFECRLDGAPPVQCGSPTVYSGLAVGDHTFEVAARDAAGNLDPTAARYVWAVAAALPAIDVSPTGRARKVSVRGRDGYVRIRWRPPAADDFSFVEIRRQRVGRRAGATSRRLQGRVVYRGTDRTWIDRGVRNDVTYRYTVVAVDTSGNHSAAIRRVGRPSRLFEPGVGAVARRPPLLRWSPVARATYYNVQLYRNGRKVLSLWPRRPRLRLRETWVFDGRRHRFERAGRIDWFVFPGFGEKREQRFGKLLGSNYFAVGRPPA